tara:strand:- start:194 stop:307 length:114 start_codon:yes stop_codon:yes gene_type:complete
VKIAMNAYDEAHSFYNDDMLNTDSIDAGSRITIETVA